MNLTRGVIPRISMSLFPLQKELYACHGGIYGKAQLRVFHTFYEILWLNKTQNKLLRLANALLSQKG